MLGLMGYLHLAIGFTWLLDAYLGFRLDAYPFLYPFDAATRQLLGMTLLMTGSLIEWMRIRRSNREILYYS